MKPANLAADRLELGPQTADLDTRRWPMRIETTRYWSRDHAAQEGKLLWPHIWQIAGRESDIPEPGDWMEYRLLDQSYLIVRGADKKVRGFVNACRHRGNALCEGRGHSARLTCPFHFWQYELDGRLRRVSDETVFGAIEKERMGLIEVSTACFGGFVFLNPDPNGEPLGEFLGGAMDLLAPYHMEEMVPSGLNVRQPLACNWKVGVEAFIEQYHVHAIHPQILTTSDDSEMRYGFEGQHNVFTVAFATASPRLGTVTPERIVNGFASLAEALNGPGAANPAEPLVSPYRDARGRIELPGNSTIRTLFQEATRDAAEKQGQDVSELTAAQMSDSHSWLLFPNVSLVVRAREVLFLCFQPDPSGDPNRCVWQVTNLRWLPPEERARSLTPLKEIPEGQSLGLILDQDRIQMPRQQRGLRNRALDQIVLGRQEARIAHFHASLDEVLISAGSRRSPR